MKLCAIFALLAVGVLASAQRADPDAGRRLYEQTCLSCHGPAGVGERGPALNTGVFSRGGSDSDLMRTIRGGVPGTQMPDFPRLSDDEMRELVAYIRSLAPDRAPNEPARTNRAEAAAGATLFFGKAGCATCHQVDGRGGIVGPDLSTAARMNAAALRARIVAPVGQTLVATSKDGRQIRGVRRNEDTFSAQIVDASGTLHLVDKSMLASFRVDSTSLMPGDYATRLSPVEIDQLVAYLGDRRERGVDPASAALPAGGVTAERLASAAAEPQNWLMYWGDYRATHFSGLKQIDRTNAARLQLAWAFQMPGPSVLEATPVVVDGIMYTTQPGVVVALDARSGRQIWRWSRPQKLRNPFEINPFNRGVAVAGQRIFVGTLDAALVALDARTGLPLWETQVGDTMLGYSITSAPLVIRDKVIVGVAGGEFGARGFLDAYDAATGKRLWRWYAVPSPGEFGADTWKGDSWKLGGSPMWLTGSYDPELNLVYWTVGNPGPQIDRSSRGDLDNLFSDSVVALDADTGQRRWHYQFTPNDGHDWDSCQAVVLVDRAWRGTTRKLLLHADRNGMFYVLDRVTGEFLSATPFVHQNWNTGFDARGRPIVVPGSNSTREGSFFVYPTVGGATNFQAPSYSALTGWLYLEYSERGQGYASAPAVFESGRQYIGRNAAAETARPKASDPPASAGIKALDPETGRTVWDFKMYQGSLTNGVVATAGDVLFASMRDGNLVALDARSGAHLWHVQTGGSSAASPMSYGIDGRQFVAIAAGNSVYAFALPDTERYSAGRSGDVVRLEDVQSATAVSIAPSVGNIAFQFTVKNHNVLHWPYSSLEEFKARPAMSGIPLVAPWANRLDEQAFYANGRRYPFDMNIGNVRGAIPIHGFLTTTDRWRVVEVNADSQSAWTTSRLEFSNDAAWLRQWPFAHTIEMTYRLRDGALEVSTRIANEAREPMPVSIGFHPYFTLTDSTRDDWTLDVGARTHWLLSDDKIPTGRTEPIERFFPDPARVALRGRVLDDVFGDLVRDSDGRATISAAGRAQRLDIVLGRNYRAVVIWAPGSDRNFVCIEPMAGITDALNLAHKGVYNELQSIPAGGAWQESFWIKPRGF